MILEIVVLLLFLGVVAFDLKTLTVPSVFTTAIIFILSVVNINNIPFGIIAFIFAFLLYEFEFIQGLADVKMIVAIGLMCSSLFGIIAMVSFVAFFGMFYNTIQVGFFKKKKYAFTVVLLLVYIALWSQNFFR